jgi:hypothetical protein
MKQKVVFIVSLPYSGSTILNIILGESKGIISLGEIGNVLLSRNLPEYCTCGCIPQDCSIWSSLFDGRISSHSSLREKYESLVNVVQETSPNTIVCDSFKSILEFPDVLKSELIDPYFIFLSKDIRSWVYSALTKTTYKINRFPIPRFFKVVYFCFFWVLKNFKFQNQLIKSNVNFLNVGYEDLCLNTESVVSSISSFIGHPVSDNFSYDILSLNSNHVLKGNRIRHNPLKNKKLFYQYDWLTSSSVITFCSIPFLFLNRRFVYSIYFSVSNKLSSK